MRFRHRDGAVVHLGYCTNVHPAERLDGVLRQLAEHAEPVRERLGADRLGLGLWLARDAAATLAEDNAAVGRLRAELDARGLEVVTLNGFPYQGFHAPVVKRAVYQPDWSRPERLRYTLDLARTLTRLLPEDAERGSVSTLPFGWAAGWDQPRQDAARRNLEALAAGLRALAAETGRLVRVALEPEPGCVVETTAEAARAFDGLDTDVLGLCLDVCHLAVGFESPAEALALLRAAGVAVVKVQASCALEAPAPGQPDTRAALAEFAEPRFLHQVREHAPGGPLRRDDLPDALDGPAALPGRDRWRVHFHVPVHAELAAPLRGSGATLRETLAELFGGPRAGADHVEVETYTWSALPPGLRPVGRAGLVEGIAAEIAHVRQQLTGLGLTELG